MSRPLSFNQAQYHSSYFPYNPALGSPAVQPAPQHEPRLYDDIAQANHTAQQRGGQPQASFPPADRRGDVEREIGIIRGVVRNTRFFQAVRLHLYLFDRKQLLRLESARRDIVRHKPCGDCRSSHLYDIYTTLMSLKLLDC